MQNLLKNKLFIILLIFLLLIVSSSNVKAGSLMSFSTYKGSNIELEIPTLPTCDTIEDFGYAILESSGNKIFLIYFSKSLNTSSPYISSGGGFVLKYESFSQASGVTKFTQGLFYRLDIDSNSWVEDGTFGSSTVDGKTLFLNSFNDVYYSTVDIYDSNGNVVFQVAPQMSQLALIVEQAETEKTQAEIVAIIPVVMVVIVALLAMRKAIAFLKRILTQA